MTEINLFPKQPQSVIVLVFITVLIVLLLILTVMVHMRNRKLKSTLEEQMAERRLLDKICADFTAVYYVELNTGSFEILHINDGTNAKKPNPNQHEFFETQAVKIYEDETRLSNEIISAIAKSYCSIYRIDVQKDFFEEDLNFAAEKVMESLKYLVSLVNQDRYSSLRFWLIVH